MLSRIGILFLLMVVLSSGCVETYQDRAERMRYRAEYGDVPQRDIFIGSIYFATASAQISRTAAADLSRIAERIKERRYAPLRVVLVGYADRRKGVEENSELAAERAQKVALSLEKRGIDLERIVIDGRPIRIERAKSGERRVDIFLEERPAYSGAAIYPILVAVFLVSVFVVAAIIFRRRR